MNTNEDSIRPIPITPETPPVFPCWLLSRGGPDIDGVEQPPSWGRAQDGKNLPSHWFTHWHPDQPQAPEGTPEAPTIRPDAPPVPDWADVEPTHQHDDLRGRITPRTPTAGGTPRTDAQEVHARENPWSYVVPADFARDLETRLQAAVKELGEARIELERAKAEGGFVRVFRGDNAELHLMQERDDLRQQLAALRTTLAEVTRERDEAVKAADHATKGLWSEWEIERGKIVAENTRLSLFVVPDLEQKLAAARKDAERYAVLRAGCTLWKLADDAGWELFTKDGDFKGATLDEVIDAARTPGDGGEGAR